MSFARQCCRVPLPCPLLLLAFHVLCLTHGVSADGLSKAHRILLERGLQLQGMVTRDDVFHLQTYTNAGYTSVNWLWTSNPALLGTAPGYPWSRWVQDETNMPPQGAETGFLPQLVTLQLADEWNLNDEAIRTRAVNWFNSVRSNFPNTILYANNYGGQVSDAALGDFISRARPDMLCFDHYPFKSDYVTRLPVGGSPTSWYSELRRYRQWALDSNIPFASYNQTFHAVQDYDRTVYRDPSPSELRLNTMGALAFNAKTLIGFTYNTGASSLFTSPGGDTYTNNLYAEQTDVNRRARNLGKALVRLKPIADAPSTDRHTTSIMMLRGRNAAGIPNPVPVGFIADPQAPNGYTDWVYQQNDPYLNGWVVTNTAGIKNGGTNGDVFISWFKPLDETFDGSSFTNEVYIMVVNGLTDPSGSAAECLQQIKLNFVFPASLTGIVMLDPSTGLLQTNTLPVVNTRRQLVLNLNGGDAVLFKFADGAPFVGFYPPDRARLGLRWDSGYPALSVEGTVAARYLLQSAPSASLGSWSTLTNLLLPCSPFVFVDQSPPEPANCFYRALLAP